MAKPRLKIIPLGGLSEIGKNMMVMEYENDIIVIDAGLMFPNEEMLGVDLVIPDISYLLEKRERIRGIIITHGHEDHVGALPYLLPQLNVPVYSTKLTQGLISVKFKQRRARSEAKLKVILPGSGITLGRFKIQFFPVCHSIPDSVGLIIHTPVGTIVHSGDFKLDYTPVDGKPTNLSRLAQLGAQGVLLLLSDSTYAELPGYTPSERVVGENLDRVIAEAPGRVIVATFSSLVSRIQQVIDSAAKHQRRVFIVGRSMSDTAHMALELGYPIPGNEALVNRTVDNLFKQGAQVLYSKVAQVHVHGHASQEELKLLLNLVKPKFFMPIHGEYRHLTLHAKLAESVGIPKDNILMLEDGDILELGPQAGRITGKVTSGNVYVDGLSGGGIGTVVLRDRRMLSRDGIVMVIIAVNKQTGKLIGRPDIVSRGFVDIREAKDMIEKSRDLVARALNPGRDRPADWGFISTKVKDVLNRFYYQETKRRPMILPFMVKV